MRYVDPVGPRDAKIMLIGEAPGRQEDEAGVPFVGGAGQMLDALLQGARIARPKVYITNVVKIRPPNNDISIYFEDKTCRTPKPKLVEWMRILDEEVRQTNPNVIVPLGNVPLQAITGLYGITNWRGSILRSKPSLVRPDGSPFKVIPTYHPAAILRQYVWKQVAKRDLLRVAAEQTTPDIVLPRREYIIEPDFDTVMLHLNRLIDHAEYISFDIETVPTIVNCLGLGDNPDWAMCIPFLYKGGRYWSPEKEVKIWKEIARLWDAPDKKFVAQNAMYDCGYLAKQHHLWPRAGIHFDTMLAQFACYCELPKGLDFLASVYTREPYYKEEGKSWRTGITDWREHWTYNCKDVAVTLECAFALEREVETLGVRKSFDRLMSMIKPLLTMTLHGTRVDTQKAQELIEDYTGQVEKAQAILNEAAGGPINANSPKQVTNLLYNVWRLPQKRHKKTGAITASEDALNELSVLHPSPAFASILTIRTMTKFAAVCRTVRDAPESRLTCTWNIANTKGGRLSSSEDMFGNGICLQNIPVRDDKRPREMFIADEGKVLVYSDLSQAELRFVAYDAQEMKLIRLIEDKKDIHTATACDMFGISEEVVLADTKLETREAGSKLYREMGKRGNHSGNYRVGPMEFCSMVARDSNNTIRLSLQEAGYILQRRLEIYPMIAQWWRWIDNEVLTKRYLTTPLGDRRIFFGRPTDTLTLKSAYSWRPQTTVGAITCIGLVNVYEKLGNEVDILLNVHDAILWQCDKDRAMELIPQVEECMTVPITLHGRTFTIPVDHKYGTSWGDLKKVKL